MSNCINCGAFEDYLNDEGECYECETIVFVDTANRTDPFALINAE